MRERLLGHVYALLAAANEDPDGRMLLPMALPDPRFSNTDSGLYALVRGDEGRFLWRSPSLTGLRLDFVRDKAPGERGFHHQRGDGPGLMVINFGIAWEDYLGQVQRYTFAVAMDESPRYREIECRLLDTEVLRPSSAKTKIAIISACDTMHHWHTARRMSNSM